MAQQGVIIPQSATPSFPGCALSCLTLLQAQSFCMPPNVPQAAQTVYNQCFCSSAFLTPFATTPDGVCVSECTIPEDRQILQAWYNNFCAQVRQGIDPTTQTTSVPPTTVTNTPGVTTGTLAQTATPTGSSTSSTGAGSSSSSNQNQSWIEGHWKWVLMLAILAIGLALLAWLALWLKKRHRRKLDAQRAAASGFNYDPEKRPASDPRRSATPDLWGPHQMMHATKGYGYATEIVEEEPKKGKVQKYRGADSRKLTKEAVEIVDQESTLASRPSTKRARPSELEINARMIGAADRRSKSKKRSSPEPSDKEINVGRPDIPRPESKQKEKATEKT